MAALIIVSMAATIPYFSLPCSITRGSWTLGSNMIAFGVTINVPFTTPCKRKAKSKLNERIKWDSFIGCFGEFLHIFICLILSANPIFRLMLLSFHTSVAHFTWKMLLLLGYRNFQYHADFSFWSHSTIYSFPFFLLYSLEYIYIHTHIWLNLNYQNCYSVSY